MKNLFKSKKGFTLVEIVIVIAIIGLLMIILIPSAINAFKNNRLQGAKIKAQRVASSLEAGIGSGKVPLTAANAKNLGITPDENNVVITTVTTVDNAINVEKVAGIKNLYNLPTNNEDLLDPLGDSATVANNNFRVYWEDAASGSSADAPKGKVFILNCADESEAPSTTGDVIYANTGNDLANPVYNK